MKDQEKYQFAYKKMKEGDFRQALAMAEDIEDIGLRAAIYIDAGFGASRSGKVREGANLFEKLLDETDKHSLNYSRTSICYNIANGYYSLYMLRIERRSTVIPPNDDDLRLAKKWFREAIIDFDDSDSEFKSMILTNYANCLSQLGRGFEAISFYLQALTEEKENGMASGNLGNELWRIAEITGRYRHNYILLAYDALKNAVSDHMHLRYGSVQAKEYIQNKLEDLQAIIDAHEDGLEIEVDESISKRISNDYVKFCLENSLFLNGWAGDPQLEPAAVDELRLGPIVTDLGDTQTVPELLKILNEIIESYSVARYLYYLSVQKSSGLSEIADLTKYFYLADYLEGLNGLHTGLCKASYARVFDVLDKTARMINIYFEIGKRRDSFWRMFATKQSLGKEKTFQYVARPEIVNKNNSSLFALADLCIDYFEHEGTDYKNIDERRNMITHDYLTVITGGDFGFTKTKEISKQDLFQETLDVFKLAKYAILYVVSAIHIAEKSKEISRTVRTIEYGHQEDSNLDE